MEGPLFSHGQPLQTTSRKGAWLASDPETSTQSSMTTRFRQIASKASKKAKEFAWVQGL